MYCTGSCNLAVLEEEKKEKKEVQTVSEVFNAKLLASETRSATHRQKVTCL